jgi:hypothetical protein
MIVTATDTLRHTKPVWNPRRGRYGSNLWQVFSPKINRKVKLYSDLEYYHWILVEATPEIIAFCEQPIKVISLVDGKDGGSYIDMWVKWNTGREEYREVKYAMELNDIIKKPRLQRQLEIQQSWCARHGAVHKIITDEEIFANALLLRNWKLILTHISNRTRNASITNIQKSITEIIRYERTITLSALVNRFVGVTTLEIHTAVFCLIHSGKLCAPLHKVELTNNITLKMSNDV